MKPSSSPSGFSYVHVVKSGHIVGSCLYIQSLGRTGANTLHSTIGKLGYKRQAMNSQDN